MTCTCTLARVVVVPRVGAVDPVAERERVGGRGRVQTRSRGSLVPSKATFEEGLGRDPSVKWSTTRGHKGAVRSLGRPEACGRDNRSSVTESEQGRVFDVAVVMGVQSTNNLVPQKEGRSPRQRRNRTRCDPRKPAFDDDEPQRRRRAKARACVAVQRHRGAGEHARGRQRWTLAERVGDSAGTSESSPSDRWAQKATPACGPARCGCRRGVHSRCRVRGGWTDWGTLGHCTTLRRFRRQCRARGTGRLRRSTVYFDAEGHCRGWSARLGLSGWHRGRERRRERHTRKLGARRQRARLQER